MNEFNMNVRMNDLMDKRANERTNGHKNTQ